MRRRLRSGFTASLLYTFSKSIDDDAFLGGQGHVLAGSQSAAPAGGQGSGQGSGGGSGQGSSGSTTTTTQSASTKPSVAQNWLNLHAERSLSSFDQRHLLNLQAQYTTGEGLRGGTLMGAGPAGCSRSGLSLATAVVGTGLPDTPGLLSCCSRHGCHGHNPPQPNRRAHLRRTHRPAS